MNEKNVLAILGSPHANGMTAAMLNCAIHRAEQNGYTVTRINLYENKNLFDRLLGTANKNALQGGLSVIPFPVIYSNPPS